MAEKKERVHSSNSVKADGNERQGVPSPEKEKEVADKILEDVAGGMWLPIRRPKKPD